MEKFEKKLYNKITAIFGKENLNNFIEKTQNKEEIKDSLLNIIFNFPEKIKKSYLKEIDEVRKFAIAIKDFELVSIAMSIYAYLKYRCEEKNSYRAYMMLNDAKYLAVSSNMYLAQKVNLFIFALMEFEEENFDDAIDFIKNAQLIKIGEFEFDNKLNTVKSAIEKAKQKRIIHLAPPSFIPDHKNDPLLALLKVGRTMAIETNLDTLLTIIAKEINLALNADRCTVFLLDTEKNELWSKVALGMDLKEIRFDAKLGLAGYVVQTGETINITDVYSDKRFNKEIDLQTGYKTKSILCMPIRNMSHEIIGAFQVLNKKGGHFTQKDEDLLIAIGSSAGIALENATLFNKQKQFIEEQKQLLSSFIDTLSASIDARDKITAGHSERVTKYAVLICEKMQMNEDELDIIRQASLLHDIGKIGIKDHILQKEGTLTKEEYDEIKKHAQITYDLLSRIYVSKYFKNVAKIASSHHEKWDGTGYFLGLKGEEIPLGGRILAVSDVFDAITSKRHYRSKMDIVRALDILIEGENKHFDKNVVDVFLSLETNKIIDVIIGNQEIEETDNFILSKYKMSDIYGLYKNTEGRKLTTEEERFVNIFNKYYNLV